MSDFIFWGSKITADGDCSHEIKRRLVLGRKVMTNLDSIFKSRDIRETRKTGSTPDTRAPSQVEGRDIQGPCFPQAFRFLGHKVFIAKAGVVTDASSLAGKLAKAIKITSAPMEQFQSQEFIQQILPRVSNDVLTRVLTAACLWQKRLETSYVVCIGVPVTNCIPYGPHTQLCTKQSESKERKLFLCKQGMIS